MAPELQGAYRFPLPFTTLTRSLCFSLAISHARGAAAKLFSTIDRVPSIDSASPEGLKPTEVIGQVEFDHVKFNYPSRMDVPILKDLSITFEAGKTAALVGASGSGKRRVSCVYGVLMC